MASTQKASEMLNTLQNVVLSLAIGLLASVFCTAAGVVLALATF